jgi:hypothetical protein
MLGKCSTTAFSPFCSFSFENRVSLLAQAGVDPPTLRYSWDELCPPPQLFCTKMGFHIPDFSPTSGSVLMDSGQPVTGIYF